VKRKEKPGWTQHEATSDIPAGGQRNEFKTQRESNTT